MSTLMYPPPPKKKCRVIKMNIQSLPRRLLDVVLGGGAMGFASAGGSRHILAF